jgi:hypothetical protein
LVGAGVGEATAVTTIRIGVGEAAGGLVAAGAGVLVGGDTVAVAGIAEGVKVGIKVRVNSAGACATGLACGVERKVAPIK